MVRAAVATLHFTRLRRRGTRAAARGLAVAASGPPAAVRPRSSQGVDKDGILRYNVQYTAMVVPGQLIAVTGPRGSSERLTLCATIAGMGRFSRPAYAWCGYRARAGRRVSPARWGRDPASGEVWRGPCRERARRGVPPVVSRGPGPVQQPGGGERARKRGPLGATTQAGRSPGADVAPTIADGNRPTATEKARHLPGFLGLHWGPVHASGSLPQASLFPGSI